MAAKLTKRVEPIYPDEAKKKRLKGTVRLHVIVGTDGTVKSLEVVSGDPILAKAATEAVQQWKYQPTLLNGEPVEVDTAIEVTFK